MLPAYLLESNHVVDITYTTRTWFDYEAEHDTIRGYWTGEIDTWGKFTIMPVSSHRPLYLFADEIVEVEAL